MCQTVLAFPGLLRYYVPVSFLPDSVNKLTSADINHFAAVVDEYSLLMDERRFLSARFDEDTLCSTVLRWSTGVGLAAVKLGYCTRSGGPEELRSVTNRDSVAFDVYHTVRVRAV